MPTGGSSLSAHRRTHCHVRNSTSVESAEQSFSQAVGSSPNTRLPPSWREYIPVLAVPLFEEVALSLTGRVIGGADGGPVRLVMPPELQFC